MKKMNSYLVLVITVVLLTLVITDVNAKEPLKLSKRECIVENIKMAISSYNTGLRKSAYELCGKLKYDELLPILLKASETEEDDYLQFVLALTLLDFNTTASNLKAEKLLSKNATIIKLSERLAKVDWN